MDKNSMDKMAFWMMMATAVGIFATGIYLIQSLHDISFNLGILYEKVSILEELNKIKP